MIVLGVLKIVSFMVALPVQCAEFDEVPPCIISATNDEPFSSFQMDGDPLKLRKFSNSLFGESENGCLFNTTDSEMIKSSSLPSTPFEIAVGLSCKQEMPIHLSNYKGDPYKHIVLFYVEIVNCTVDLNDINNLINGADAVALRIASKINTNSETSKSYNDNGLQNVVSFVYDNMNKDAQHLSGIFKINQTYPGLAEITLLKMALEVLPPNINEILPNLQSLELPNNNLTLPPYQFPWTESTVGLPRNISRSPFMQSVYCASEHVDIPNNIFRRFFNLDDNSIKDLQNFIFHGMLHKISLRRNGLRVIGKDTFSNTTGLQNLDLSENELRTVPQDVFNGLVSLRSLDISSNHLEIIPMCLFDDLYSLQNLNLANNSITTLPESVFSNLYKLEELRLNHNKLTKLPSPLIPLSLIHVKRLYFHFNPLKTLPVFPFFIRTLRLADFHSTDITFKNLTQLLEAIDAIRIYESTLNSASTTYGSDLLKRNGVLRKIDLSNCNISSLKVEKSLPKKLEQLLYILLLHFRFDLWNNRIICDCNINNLAKFIDMHVVNGTIREDEYFFQNWICRKPRELARRQMLKIEAKDTYCEAAVTGCPFECSCYERSTLDHIIVDCRNQSLFRIHTELPNALLELWYSENNITEITDLAKPENIFMLDVSFNKVEVIHAGVFNKMKNLRDVRLHSNVLISIPSELKNLNLTTITIWPNPFTCDCKTRWMKKWLQNKRKNINESYNVACKIAGEAGMLFTEVPDEKFVCHTKSKFDEIRYVVLPSVVSSTVIIFVLISVVLFYTYRLECKVLLYVYFGVHPFDRDSSEKHENIDCVVVHSGIQTEWVMETIVSLLENENYHFVVCDMARDFVVGYSFQENLTRTVRHSKRMIFCLSHDWPTSSENFVIAWRIAQEKIKETKSHYGIIVSHDIKVNEINDKDLKRFIRRGRFIDSKDKLFRNKVVYYMPQTIKTANNNSQIKRFQRKSEYISRCFINSYCEDIVHEQETDLSADAIDISVLANTHAFISYHDDDFQYVLKELLPLLDGKGFTYCISDRDFVPGASIEENILNAIGRCQRTIFILSPSHVQDEWLLFTFRAAYEKSLREKSNHLLVLIKEKVEQQNLDEEMSHYLKNYICLNINDRWFEKKLFNGLSLLKDKEDLHTRLLCL